jgi:hypothetical protein
MNNIALSSRIEAPPLVAGRRYSRHHRCSPRSRCCDWLGDLLRPAVAGGSSVTGEVITVEVYAYIFGSFATYFVSRPWFMPFLSPAIPPDLSWLLRVQFLVS